VAPRPGAVAPTTPSADVEDGGSDKTKRTVRQVPNKNTWRNSCLQLVTHELDVKARKSLVHAYRDRSLNLSDSYIGSYFNLSRSGTEEEEEEEEQRVPLLLFKQMSAMRTAARKSSLKSADILQRHFSSSSVILKTPLGRAPLLVKQLSSFLYTGKLVQKPRLVKVWKDTVCSAVPSMMP